MERQPHTKRETETDRSKRKNEPQKQTGGHTETGRNRCTDH